jgi:uncharacterized Ntn-hydrolase superfamily protein
MEASYDLLANLVRVHCRAMVKACDDSIDFGPSDRASLVSEVRGPLYEAVIKRVWRGSSHGGEKRGAQSSAFALKIVCTVNRRQGVLMNLVALEHSPNTLVID